MSVEIDQRRDDPLTGDVEGFARETVRGFRRRARDSPVSDEEIPCADLSRRGIDDPTTREIELLRRGGNRQRSDRGDPGADQRGDR